MIISYCTEETNDLMDTRLMHKAGEYIYLFTYSDEAGFHDPGMYSSVLFL